MNRRFERSEMLLGSEGMDKLKNSKVLVLGVGGVGSFVVEGLVRAGVGELSLCDHDNLDITNINRQIHATTQTVGRIKAEVMKERIFDINPDCLVKVYPYLYNEETSEEIVTNELDYVVDAIDMVSSKLHLVERCQELGIPLIASMGTGNKMNPMMLEVTDIYKTKMCPLAKVMRKELKRRGVKKLKVLYSKEEPLRPKFVEAPNDEGDFKRRSVPGSMSFVPSVAGLIIASEVVKDLIGWNQ